MNFLTNTEKIHFRFLQRLGVGFFVQTKPTAIVETIDFRTSDGRPYVNSPELAADKEKLSKLVAEYNSLVESFVIANLVMYKKLTYDDGNHTLKYRPEFDRWDFYVGSECKPSIVKFSEDSNSITVTVPTQNSDMHGELHNVVYEIKVAPTVDPIVKQVKAEPRCSKIDEGLAAVPTTDEAYYKKLGLVKDPTYGTWRKPTTEEYDKILKQQQKKEPIKKKRKIPFFNR